MVFSIVITDKKFCAKNKKRLISNILAFLRSLGVIPAKEIVGIVKVERPNHKAKPCHPSPSDFQQTMKIDGAF